MDTEPRKRAPRMGEGRPSKFSKELADTICEQLAQGKSMRTVCATDDMPDMATVFRWLRTNDEFCKQYARAKEESTDAMAEEILDLSDGGLAVVKGMAEKKSSAAAQIVRLQVDTRKWLMSKMKPKKYGDKSEVDLTSKGERIVFMPPEILGKHNIGNEDTPQNPEPRRE